MPELQGPVQKSKQFGGRSKTERHARPEQTASERVWRFHLPDGKEAPTQHGAEQAVGTGPRRALSPEKRSFSG